MPKVMRPKQNKAKKVKKKRNSLVESVEEPQIPEPELPVEKSPEKSLEKNVSMESEKYAKIGVPDPNDMPKYVPAPVIEITRNEDSVENLKKELEDKMPQPMHHIENSEVAETPK